MDTRLVEDVKIFVEKSGRSSQIDITQVIKMHLPDGRPSQDVKAYLVNQGFGYFPVEKKNDQNQKIIYSYKVRAFLQFLSYSEIRIIFDVDLNGNITNVTGYYFDHSI
jgi:hypothetical protein